MVHRVVIAVLRTLTDVVKCMTRVVEANKRPARDHHGKF